MAAKSVRRSKRPSTAKKTVSRAGRRRTGQEAVLSESEFKIEWLFINLRWFFLLAVAGVIGIDVALKSLQFPSAVLALLVVGSVANVIALATLLQNA
mgnify:FL=1